MVYCGYHAVCGTFNIYLENDKMCIDGSGSVDGTCYVEHASWECPGHTENELDVDTLSITANVSTVEENFEDSKTISLCGIEAWNFLEENGFEEKEIDWDVDDNYYDEDDYDDYD
mgnify:CR=1 FL=1